MPVSNDWWHLAVTWNGTFVAVYINGSIVQSRNWTSQIVDFNSELSIGRSSVALDGRDGIALDSISPPCNATIDAVGIWNISKASTIDASYNQIPDFINDRNLVAFFSFDEGYGLSSASKVGSYTANLYPEWDKKRSHGANENWVVSSAPINDYIITYEDFPIIIALNATDPLSTTLLFTVTAAPANGNLYLLGDTSQTHPNINLFPVVGSLILSGQTFQSRRVIYIPSLNFNGIESFSYSATSQTDGRTSPSATITIAVLSVTDPPELEVLNGALILEPFGIVDKVLH